jgi:hypothetical protein
MQAVRSKFNLSAKDFIAAKLRAERAAALK